MHLYTAKENVFQHLHVH